MYTNNNVLINLKTIKQGSVRLSKLRKPYFNIDLPILLHKLILAGIATQVGCRSSAKADQSAK